MSRSFDRDSGSFPGGLSDEEIAVRLRELADEFDPSTDVEDPTQTNPPTPPEADVRMFPEGGVSGRDNLDHRIRRAVLGGVHPRLVTRESAAGTIRQLANHLESDH